ncbi:hypothetical protein QNI19_32050 [Cytophagaceae bacterium DM2B3-1]|uniref:Uncharacterized protein n=1 Tax=Xanthocytophaga flava TaxID=3048013 RepID=A0ABT7CVT0_9BACT|nr:hypothetical protein [Xanthocytophaga flavus]MDJ1497616.1 hypothetical protein [Xanthocytophaga flavus]
MKTSTTEAIHYSQEKSYNPWDTLAEPAQQLLKAVQLFLEKERLPFDAKHINHFLSMTREDIIDHIALHPESTAALINVRITNFPFEFMLDKVIEKAKLDIIEKEGEQN